jgi:hypothetical protein
LKELKLVISDFNDKKGIQKKIKEFNSLYKDIENITFIFPEDIKIQGVSYLIENLKCPFKYFKENIKFECNSQEDIALLGHEIYTEKRKNRIKKTIQQISIFIGAVVLGMLIFNYGPKLYDKYYMPFVKKAEIKAKIDFLIYERNIKPMLKRLLEKRCEGETVEQSLKDLPECIYNSSKTFNVSENLLIAIVCEESEFYKYSVSSVGAVGFGQIYMEVWGNLITNDKEIFTAKENLYWTGYILRVYMDKNNNDVYNALYMYNGGKYRYNNNTGKIEATEESFNHLKKVFNTMNKLAEFETRKNQQD